MTELLNSRCDFCSNPVDRTHSALKAAEPWLFEDVHAGGTTGLEPAGAAGGDDGELRRWRGIAGLEDGN